MERIRRAVLATPDEAGSFATSYATVLRASAGPVPALPVLRLPPPSTSSWWDGFDPYYSTCSAFTVHVNYSWWWGPSYWYGFVPYYVYTYRHDLPADLQPGCGAVYSSWNGWNTWCNLWGGPLRRYKSAPPANYVGPSEGAADRPVAECCGHAAGISREPRRRDRPARRSWAADACCARRAAVTCLWFAASTVRTADASAAAAATRRAIGHRPRPGYRA